MFLTFVLRNVEHGLFKRSNVLTLCFRRLIFGLLFDKWYCSCRTYCRKNDRGLVKAVTVGVEKGQWG